MCVGEKPGAAGPWQGSRSPQGSVPRCVGRRVRELPSTHAREIGFHQGCKSLRPDIRHRRRELLQSLSTLAQAHGVFLQNIMGLTTLLRILWTPIAGGKKLKGGVAMEHP
jgi:hypothetical protein